MSMVDPSKWAGNWGTGVTNAGGKWRDNYIAAGDQIFKKGSAAGPSWQAGVANPQALSRYQTNLGRVTMAQVSPTVQGAGMSKYTSAGSTKQAKYQSFATIFGPKLTSIVSGLPARGPRGSAQNRARLNQLLDQIQATRGSNHA